MMAFLDRLLSATAFLLLAVTHAGGSHMFPNDDAACDTMEGNEAAQSNALLQVKSDKTARAVLEDDDDLVSRDSVKKHSGERDEAPTAGALHRDEAPTVGALQSLTEEGFQATTAACCEKETEAFMRRFIEDSDYMIFDEGGLQGMVPFFTCKSGAMTLQNLTEAVDNMANSACPTWVKIGAPIPARTPECEAANPGVYNPTWHRRRNCPKAKVTALQQAGPTTQKPHPTSYALLLKETVKQATKMTTTTTTTSKRKKTTRPATTTTTSTTTSKNKKTSTTTSTTTTTTETTTEITTTTTTTTTTAMGTALLLVQGFEDHAKRLVSDLWLSADSFWQSIHSLR
mmetsp:Transcript_35134/g.63202  ORF Transcript_35134/g.63202 Transcript_35134/m.63202 type:complete len:343 (-) Transcript_35134:112-1140(-)